MKFQKSHLGNIERCVSDKAYNKTTGFVGSNSVINLMLLGGGIAAAYYIGKKFIKKDDVKSAAKDVINELETETIETPSVQEQANDIEKIGSDLLKSDALKELAKDAKVTSGSLLRKFTRRR